MRISNRFSLTLVLIFLSSVRTLGSTPCPNHPGSPKPWEGSGACTGNFIAAIPAETAGVTFLSNSVRRTGNFGLGARGWRLSIDQRIAVTNASTVTMSLGDGSEYRFVKNSSGKWVPDEEALRFGVLTGATTTTFSWRNGRVESVFTPFGAHGLLLTEVKAPFGNTTIARSASTGSILSVTDAEGRVVQINYSGNSVTVTDWAGKNYLFSENDSGGSVIRSDNTSTTWALTGDLITAFKPAYGATSFIRYLSNDGVVAEMVDPLNYVTRFTYTATTVEVADAFSKRTETFSGGTLPALTQVVQSGKTLTLTRGTKNRLTRTSTAFGGTFDFSYDTHGNVTKQVGDGLEETYTYNALHLPLTHRTLNLANSRALTESWEYNTYGEVTKHTSMGGVVSAFTLNTQGLVTRVTTGGVVTASMTYDSNGNPTSTTDAFGFARQATYNDVGYLESVTDSAGRTTTMAPDTFGRPTSVTTASGMRATSSYDEMGRVTNSAISGPSGNTESVSISRQFSTNVVKAPVKKSKKVMESSAKIPLIMFRSGEKKAEANVASGPEEDKVRTGVTDLEGNTTVTNCSCGTCATETDSNGSQTVCTGLTRQRQEMGVVN